MKRLFTIIIALLSCISMVACDEVLPGVGDSSGESETYFDCGTPYLTDDITSIESMPPETIETIIEVDWSDFVRVGGVSYQGNFYGKTVDKSFVGEKIGEILYNVKSTYSSMDEMQEASNRDMTASFRPVGCEVFKIKDDENSIAVLDDGEYYVYTRN